MTLLTRQKTKRDHRIKTIGGGRRVFSSNKMETETETGNASKCKKQLSKKTLRQETKIWGESIYK